MAGRKLTAAMDYARAHPLAPAEEVASAASCSVSVARTARQALGCSRSRRRRARWRSIEGTDAELALAALADGVAPTVAQAAELAGCTRANVYAMLRRVRAGEIGGWWARRGKRRGAWLVRRLKAA